MIRHVFMWRLVEGADGGEVIDLLNTLSDRLGPVIASWEVGQHQGEPNDNGDPWAGALITDFRSWEDLESYSQDPFHMEVVGKLLPLLSDRAVVDYSVGTAA